MDSFGGQIPTMGITTVCKNQLTFYAVTVLCTDVIDICVLIINVYNKYMSGILLASQ